MKNEDFLGAYLVTTPVHSYYCTACKSTEAHYLYLVNEQYPMNIAVSGVAICSKCGHMNDLTNSFIDHSVHAEELRWRYFMSNITKKENAYQHMALGVGTNSDSGDLDLVKISGSKPTSLGACPVCKGKPSDLDLVFGISENISTAFYYVSCYSVNWCEHCQHGNIYDMHFDYFEKKQESEVVTYTEGATGFMSLAHDYGFSITARQAGIMPVDAIDLLKRFKRISLLDETGAAPKDKLDKLIRDAVNTVPLKSITPSVLPPAPPPPPARPKILYSEI